MENQTNLELNNQAVDALRESAKWSMFLAILGFIGIGIMIIAALLMGSAFAMMPTRNTALGGGFNPFGAMKGVITAFYIVLAIIYFFPVYYLYKYASGMKAALSIYNSDLVSDALVQLKSHHKFLGIMMIVMIAIYIIAIIGFVIFFASMATKGL